MKDRWGMEEAVRIVEETLYELEYALVNQDLDTAYRFFSLLKLILPVVLNNSKGGNND